jgi:hypothetical protein
MGGQTILPIVQATPARPSGDHTSLDGIFRNVVHLWPCKNQWMSPNFRSSAAFAMAWGLSLIAGKMLRPPLSSNAGIVVRHVVRWAIYACSLVQAKRVCLKFEAPIMLSVLIRKLPVLLAWVSLGYIVYVTLSPIGLRPVASNNPAYERLAAYAMVGILFGLAYRRRVLALGIVVGTAIALEGLQYLTPDRHGRLVDLVEKASGGLLGVLVAIAASRYLARS